MLPSASSVPSCEVQCPARHHCVSTAGPLADSLAPLLFALSLLAGCYDEHPTSSEASLQSSSPSQRQSFGMVSPLSQMNGGSPHSI